MICLGRTFRKRIRVSRSVVSMLLGAACLSASLLQTPGQTAPILLTNLQQVAALTDDDLSQHAYGARVQGVITYIPPQGRRLYVQEGRDAIYADFTNSVATRQPGERIELVGPVKRGFLVPRILPTSFRVLGNGPLPEPQRVDVARLAAGEAAVKFVVVRGTVRDMMLLEGPFLMLLVSEQGTSFRIHTPVTPGAALPREWLDAFIEARGVCRPVSDNFGKPFGFVLYQNHTNQLTVLRPGAANPFERPLLTIQEATLRTNRQQLRLRIAGTVLAHVPGKTLYVQDPTGVMRVGLLPLLPKTIEDAQYLEHEPQTQLQPGEQVEVIGARDEGFFLTPGLSDGEFRRVGRATVPDPRLVSVSELEAGAFPGRLVTLRARLLDQRASSTANTWHQGLVLQAGEHVFQARWEGDAPQTWNLPSEGYVQVTGVNEVEQGDLKRARTFHVVLRTPTDVTPTDAPPLWTRPTLRRAAGIFALAAVLASGWVAFQRRQRRRMRAADEAARRSEAVTRTLNYFATSLLEQHTEDDILWDLARNCISQLGFEDCVVYLLDRERGVLVQKAALGPKSPEGRLIVNPLIIPLGQGIVGSVAVTGIPELIGDTSGDPRYIVDDARRSSEIAVPIIADGDVIGVIDSEHVRKHFYTPDHLKMLTAIASLCANKLVRVRAEQQLRASHHDLERRIAERTAELQATNEQLTREISERARAEKVQRALYAISEAIHNVEDLPSLYERIHQIIGTLMPAGNFYIALQDPVTEMVSFPYHRDEMDPPPPPRKGRRGMTEYVLRTGRAALADLEEIARLKDAGEYSQSGAPAKIWLGVPLSSGGRPFGVMALQDHHNERVYGEEEKQILGFVAGQTALAIERKLAENNLRVALAAEKEINQLKSSFVSMVSHEFRTPLGVILSSSNILDRYLDRLPPEKRAAQLRAIRKSVHRMNDLIDDVLLLGKFDAGALCCQPTPLDLVSFCRRAAREIESAAAREGAIRFTTDEVNGEATADEGLLQHILMNILGNAVKYSPPDRAVDFALVRRGPDAEFVIRDRGCGIPAADQARLFTAFYRGSNVGQTSGSGLGLVIAKRCLDLHGGTIRCHSEPGEGTTFTVTLPLFDGTRVFHRRPNGGQPLADPPVRPNH